MNFRQASLGVGLLCGAFAPVWWVAMILYCASLFPGYSHLTDFISELAARRSPTQELMAIGGFIVTGGLYLAFAATLAWQFRRDRRAWFAAPLLALGGLARIGSGVYPCEPGCAADAISASQEWHYRYAALGFGLMMAAAVAWGFVGNRYQKLRQLLALGIGTAMWCAVALLLMEFHPAWQGLFQRLASGILSLWVLVLAVLTWRIGELPEELETRSALPRIKASRRRRRPKR
ncbi:MAG: DUF998 domain-containing protein [Gammaproteobacteria bacterium]|nr:DUF998 domain-containing protein [Gammaproteobacteria bacterium]